MEQVSGPAGACLADLQCPFPQAKFDNDRYWPAEMLGATPADGKVLIRRDNVLIDELANMLPAANLLGTLN